ncbi:MAG: hypothetical protein A2W19_13365 [Spirochaetes bacterium RBG_16_49_21]|nr:MAG: hypothetical protein A2W19_13365 [Spirochaetes bacterium RBG_16_49_21]
MDVALRGEYHFLNGVIMTDSCHAGELLYDAWRHYTNTDYVYLLDVPRIVNDDSIKIFQIRLQNFIVNFENHFSIKITEQSLFDAAALYNKNRALLENLYNLRKLENPPITGLEMIQIMNKNWIMDIESFNNYLQHFLSVIENNPNKADLKNRKRIMLMGGKISHPELIKIIEDDGDAVIVFEDICTYYRYFDRATETDQDILYSLSKRYLSKIPCPRMMDDGTRWNAISKIIDEYTIDGVIYHSLKFCVTNSIKALTLKEQIHEIGKPFLYIEGDYTLNCIEQLRTRIRTFLDLI